MEVNVNSPSSVKRTGWPSLGPLRKAGEETAKGMVMAGQFSSVPGWDHGRA